MGFWAICGIFKFQCPDENLEKILCQNWVCYTHNLQVHKCIIINTIDTYPAPFNLHCLQYAWPDLQLFKSLVWLQDVFENWTFKYVHTVYNCMNLTSTLTSLLWIQILLSGFVYILWCCLQLQNIDLIIAHLLQLMDRE